MKNLKLTIRILLLPITGFIALCATILFIFISVILTASCIIDWASNGYPKWEECLLFAMPFVKLYEFTFKGIQP